MYSNFRRMRNKRSFTLVELLVVIAIISILAAMLLPALQRASDLAKQTSCLNNLHQLSISANMYMNDYDEYVPHLLFNSTYWYCALAPYAGVENWPMTASPTIGLVKGTVFHCPVWIMVSGYNFYGYGMNYFVPNLGGSLACINDESKWPKLSLSNDPSRQMYLADGGDWHLSGATASINPVNSAYKLGHDRHNNGANILFCDLHTKWIPQKTILAEETELYNP